MVARIQGTEVGSSVPVYASGTRVKGEFHCVECGYGVAIHDRLPSCPMCRCGRWKAAAWSPFGRTAAPLPDVSARADGTSDGLDGL